MTPIQEGAVPPPAPETLQPPVVAPPAAAAAAFPSATPNLPPPADSAWKEVREWASICLSLVALVVAGAGYKISRSSADLERTKYDEQRAIIVVGEKVNNEEPKGMMFKLHAQDPAQRLTNLRITVPSIFHIKAWESNPENQEISLFPLELPLGRFCLDKLGRTKDNITAASVSIPVILDAAYSVSGVSMERRGLYLLRAFITITDREYELPSVTFQDFAFADGVDMKADPQLIVDRIMGENAPTVHSGKSAH